jgi:hypothetical protein
VIVFCLSVVTIQDPSLKPLEYLFSIAYNIVSLFLGLGLSLCALELIRTRTTSIGTGFSILKKIVSLIVFHILILLLAVVVIGIPFLLIIPIGMGFQAVMGGPDMDEFIIFLLGVPWVILASFVLSYRLAFYGPLLIVDQKVSAIRAVSMSWAMTKRNTLTLFSIFLVFGLAAFAGTIITLLLGVFVIIPFGICLTAMCYHIMWEQYSAKTAGQQTSEW